MGSGAFTANGDRPSDGAFTEPTIAPQLTHMVPATDDSVIVWKQMVLLAGSAFATSNRCPDEQGAAADGGTYVTGHGDPLPGWVHRLRRMDRNSIVDGFTRVIVLRNAERIGIIKIDAGALPGRGVPLHDNLAVGLHQCGACAFDASGEGLSSRVRRRTDWRSNTLGKAIRIHPEVRIFDAQGGVVIQTFEEVFIGAMLRYALASGLHRVSPFETAPPGLYFGFDLAFLEIVLR